MKFVRDFLTKLAINPLIVRMVQFGCRYSWTFSWLQITNSAYVQTLFLLHENYAMKLCNCKVVRYVPINKFRIVYPSGDDTLSAFSVGFSLDSFDNWFDLLIVVS